ncbi:uncharacterized protein LOC133190282 [Saccostrea echinata]|uniref:uncharacterized protein LOC133190282 n=1 Tax=Saccostrea echinata TaxID=191078 RepID=UPI002A839275|nr:uncharacterized protein LOC133190282 [Saccostrea echinata]
MGDKPDQDKSPRNHSSEIKTSTKTGPANRSGGPSFVADFAKVGAYSCLAVTFTAPLDRVKLLLQCQHELRKTGRLSKPYKGALECALRIYRTEGFIPLFRGNLIACVKPFPEQAINFAMKEAVKKMTRLSKEENAYIKLAKNLCAGFLGSFATLGLVYSLDYCRTRMAADVLQTGKDGTKKRQFSGIIDVYRQTMRSDGIVGLHRGFVVSCLGIIVYRGAYFGFYDTLSPMLLKTGQFKLFYAFGLGYGVTVLAGLVSYPLDTIRRRMMMTSCEQVKYKGWIDCARYAIKNDGFFSLYRGVFVTIVKGFLGVPFLIGYDVLKQNRSKS